MPNWCSNSLTVRGTKKNVLDFINKGLKVLGVQAKDIEEAKNYINLYDSYSSDNPLIKKRKPYDSCGRTSFHKNKHVTTSFSLECFFPMPDIYYEADTTNSFKSSHRKGTKAYSKEEERFNKLKELQQTLYGAVGWYDWHCKYYGTKWNAGIEFCDMREYEDYIDVDFFIDTAWSPCINWLQTVQNENQLVRFHMISEEPGMVFKFDYMSDGFDDDPSTYIEDEDEISIYQEDLSDDYERELQEEYGDDED